MTEPETWEDSQKFESEFWGDCSNTFTEELKQLVYMDRMGFSPVPDHRGPYNWLGAGKSFIDIGGGPTSVLLKMLNAKHRVVVDPCDYPHWVMSRYREAGIEFRRHRGEDIWVEYPPRYDIALIYNCLQHTQDPKEIVRRAFAISRETHMFEWIDIPSHPGHPHCLTESLLQSWTGLIGKTESFSGLNECFGRAWFC